MPDCIFLFLFRSSHEPNQRIKEGEFRWEVVQSIEQNMKYAESSSSIKHREPLFFNL